MFGEQGRSKEFKKWEKEIIKYEGKIWQWKVFPSVIKIAKGCLSFANKNYEEAITAYLSGYIELVALEGYGTALYGMHINRIFNNIQKIDDVELRKHLLMRIKDTWSGEGLSEKFPGFIKRCELQLLTIDLF